MSELLDWLMYNPLFAVLSTATLIQVVPIKVNPWTWLWRRIKLSVLGDVIGTLDKMSKRLDALEEQRLRDKLDETRWMILEYARSCLMGAHHTSEQWHKIISELDWYADTCHTQGIKNGEIEDAERYLRGLHYELTCRGEFLTYTAPQGAEKE